MTARRAERRSARPVGALAWSALLWLAAGFLVGSVIHGKLAAIVGVPMAISVAVAAVALPLRLSTPPRQAASAAAENRDTALAASAALARTMSGLDDPDKAILDMLRVVAAAVESDTALLLVPGESGTALRLEHPALVKGRPAGRAVRSLRLAESGPVRLALAAGVPVAAEAKPEDPIAWEAFRSEHGIESAAVVPLTVAGVQFGAMVLGTGEVPSKSHLMGLRTVMPAAGGAIGAVLRLRDLARTTAETARTVRFRADYASVVGHELRTPLTTILGVIKTLERPGMVPENEDARDLLAMANAQGDRLKRLVEDMLAINQADLDRIPIRPEMVSLPDLIDRAIASVPGTEALTTVHIQSALPPVILDPDHTTRILVNLLANALKYGEETPIDISVAVERDELVLAVADHGPGLPPATASLAFDAFTQLKRTEVNACGGVGLGLSISRGLAEAMGGNIRHRPTEGGGATFVIRFPFKPHVGAIGGERR